LTEELRLSKSALRLIALFAQDPTQKWSGAEITREIGMGAGTLYPLLYKFETAKWLIPEWENIDPREEGRPRQRYYRLSANGARRAHQALDVFQIPGRLAWNS